MSWLDCCFFLFLSYTLFTFLFYMLFDNVLMKTYSFCGGRGDKKGSKETKIYGVKASKWVLLVYLLVFFFFAEPKNELSILSSISFLLYESQKIKFLKTFCNLHNTFTIEMINNPPIIQFFYKFKFILCQNWGTSYKDINQNSQLFVVHLVVWSVFPGIFWIK